MKTLAIALSSAVLLSACATSSGGQQPEPAKSETFEVVNPVRLALQPVSVPPELEGSAAPAVFGQTLCNRLFELNKKQVMCADEVKIFLESKRQELVLGGSTETNMDELLKNLDAPRRVNLVAAKAGDALVSMSVLIQDRSGKTIDRFQINLKADGSDVFERANEAALKIVKIPADAK